MVNTKSSTSTKRPEPFNPNANYPQFDRNATENIDGENVHFLNSLLDTTYLRPVPVTLKNLSVLSPEDHRIHDAVTHNIALQLLTRLRPRWPLNLFEWLVIPDQLYRTCKEQRMTEKYLKESLSASPERKAAFYRVMRSLSPERISLMSHDAQLTALTAFYVR